MLGIIDLLNSDGIYPKKVTNREYHSPCPSCGGQDRFAIWPEEGDTGRGWCRQCGIKLDSISYLMQLHSMDYREAAAHIGKSIPPGNKTARIYPVIPTQEPENNTTTIQWSRTAGEFLSWSKDNLSSNKRIQDWLLEERGIPFCIAEKLSLGWNPKPLVRPAAKWGLDRNDLFIPAGLVIPNIVDGKIVSMKIRKGEGEPRYHLVRGSSVLPYVIYGDVKGTIAVFESELDAMLVNSVCSDVVTAVSLGSCSNRPDVQTAELMMKAGVLLNCFDDDMPGENEWDWWVDRFPHSYRWKPILKDPGEMFVAGESVRSWIFKGIREVLAKEGLHPGKLDFYQAIDELAEPFPEEVLMSLSEEEIERKAIQSM